MAKLLGLVLVVGALAATAALVPVGGRTILDRWRTSRSPSEFASRTYGEVAVAVGLREPPTRRSSASPARAGNGPRRNPPVERHTDADRAALERIVAERAEK